MTTDQLTTAAERPAWLIRGAAPLGGPLAHR